MLIKIIFLEFIFFANWKINTINLDLGNFRSLRTIPHLARFFSLRPAIVWPTSISMVKLALRDSLHTIHPKASLVGGLGVWKCWEGRWKGGFVWKTQARERKVKMWNRLFWYILVVQYVRWAL